MTRSIALLAAAAIAVFGVLLVGDSMHGALFGLAVLSPLGAGALALAHAGARARRRLGPLRRQFAFAVALVSVQALVAVAAAVALMFVSRADAVLTCAMVVFAGVVGVRVAQVLAAGALDDVRVIRDGLAAVRGGEREVALQGHAGGELRELATETERTVARLAAEEAARAQADQARRHLIAAVSHDLRTPLTSLRLVVEAISDDVVDEPTRRRYLDQMGTQIATLSALIDDLFELTRLEAGDIRWTMEQVPLAELVEETVSAMAVQARARRIEVRAEVPAELAPARANPERVQRVLFNLIQNAIRHTPPDGSVVVRAEPAGATVEIEVADTGEGIAASERDRVFEAFFRAGDNAARSADGAGLGLAISRAIVEAHGGRIWLVDSPSGTRVRFSLPTAAQTEGIAVAHAAQARPAVF